MSRNRIPSSRGNKQKPKSSITDEFQEVSWGYLLPPPELYNQYNESDKGFFKRIIEKQVDQRHKNEGQSLENEKERNRFIHKDQQKALNSDMLIDFYAFLLLIIPMIISAFFIHKDMKIAGALSGALSIGLVVQAIYTRKRR